MSRPRSYPDCKMVISRAETEANESIVSFGVENYKQFYIMYIICLEPNSIPCPKAATKGYHVLHLLE